MVEPDRLGYKPPTIRATGNQSLGSWRPTEPGARIIRGFGPTHSAWSVNTTQHTPSG